MERSRRRGSNATRAGGCKRAGGCWRAVSGLCLVQLGCHSTELSFRPSWPCCLPTPRSRRCWQSTSRSRRFRGLPHPCTASRAVGRPCPLLPTRKTCCIGSRQRHGLASSHERPGGRAPGRGGRRRAALTVHRGNQQVRGSRLPPGRRWGPGTGCAAACRRHRRLPLPAACSCVPLRCGEPVLALATPPRHAAGCALPWA